VSRMAIGIGAALFVALLAAGFVLGGEARQFLLAGAEALPFIVLAVLAQWGQNRTWARVLTFVWLYLMMLAFSILVILLTVGALNQAQAPNVLAGLGWTVLALFGSFLVATPLLFRGVRVRLARIIPIDPDSLIHKVALVFIAFFVLASFLQLAILGGQPSLLTIVAGTNTDATGGRSSAGQILDLFYGLAWMLPMAAIAAGFPIRRTFLATLDRLGLVRPSWRQVAFGVAAAIALVFVLQGLDIAISWVWEQFGWPTTNAETFKKLMGAGFSLPGAVAVGITAGIGEEVTTRGLLQPRLGILLPNLAFTAAHAFQYAPDALISVFVTGLILGLIRSRSNTSTAAIVHGGYDFFIILSDVLGF
jgi:membrane protease YdiL (CAAX protease family)